MILLVEAELNKFWVSTVESWVARAEEHNHNLLKDAQRKAAKRVVEYWLGFSIKQYPRRIIRPFGKCVSVPCPCIIIALFTEGI